MIRVLAACASVLAVAVLTAGPASANGGTAIGLNISDSRITLTSSSGTQCTWDLVSDVTVVNLTGQPLTFTDVVADVTYKQPSGPGALDNVHIATNGGLQAGDTLPAFGQHTYTPFETTFTIPCAATDGDLAVKITTPSGTGSGDAPFLAGGSPLPISAAGGLALAGFLGVGLLVLQRRRRPALASFPPTTSSSDPKGSSS